MGSVCSASSATHEGTASVASTLDLGSRTVITARAKVSSFAKILSRVRSRQSERDDQ